MLPLGRRRANWMLMGTRHAEGPVSAAHFTAQWRDPIVGPQLRRLGVERPEQLGALFMAGASDLRMLTQETKPLTDDHPKRLSAQRPSRQRTRGLYEQLMDVEGTQERFQKSELIARLWPVSLREGSLEHFKSQESINDFFSDPSHAAAIDFPRLHQILTETPLRTLPLWLLMSDAQFQRAVGRAKAKGIQHPEIDYHLGARALSGRDYSRAEAHFRAGQERGAAGREVLYYRLYALCMAGRLEEAAALAGQLEVQGDAQPHDRGVLTFLSETFGLDRSVHVEDADPGGTPTP